MGLFDVQADSIPFLHRTTWFSASTWSDGRRVAHRSGRLYNRERALLWIKQHVPRNTFVCGWVGRYFRLSWLYCIPSSGKTNVKILMVGIATLCRRRRWRSCRERLDSVMRATNSTNQPGSRTSGEVDGKTIYQKGYGLAMSRRKRRITPETNFRMASVSKQFTAMGILLLEKEGKLSLMIHLTKFFPDFNRAVLVQKVQIRHLLTHSSGILDYEAVMNPKPARATAGCRRTDADKDRGLTLF